MPVFLKARKNNNSKSTAYGKYFGHVVASKTMTYSELCRHMSEHNSIFGEDVCLGVANKLQNCILEQLLEGKKVQFGELGTFYLSVKGTGADTEEDFSVSANVNGLYLRFAASRMDVNDLSSKTLKKRASFMNAKELIASKTKKTTTDDTNSTNGTDPNNTPSGNETGGNNSGGTTTGDEPGEDRP